MGKTDRILTWVVTVVMLLFCLFLIAYLPLRADLDFQLTDVELSLETSRGRERKQQAEYDEVTEQLPLTRAELTEARALADEAAAEVTALKEERKALRAEKRELEAAAENSGDAGREESHESNGQ